MTSNNDNNDIIEDGDELLETKKMKVSSLSMTVSENKNGYPTITMTFVADMRGHVYEFMFSYRDEIHEVFREFLHSMFEAYFDQEVLNDIGAVIERMMDEYDMSDEWYQRMNILLSVLRAVAYGLPMRLTLETKGGDSYE